MRGPLPSYCPEFPTTFLEQAEKVARQRTGQYLSGSTTSYTQKAHDIVD
jgi:hypothetical protein